MSIERYVYAQRRRILATLGISIACLFAFLFVYSYLFGPTDKFASQNEFLINTDESLTQVASTLKEEGYIRSAWAFRVAYESTAHHSAVRPGGYKISASMDTWSVASAIAGPPYLSFITIPAGYRKEQIATVLADALSWTPAQKQEWLTVDTATSPDTIEGVYAPGTYLIPSDQTPAQVAERMRSRFMDSIRPYATLAAAQHLTWTQILTLASLVEREAAKNDKPLIAGILLNRLADGMRLQVDATLQYAKGSDTNGWWGAVTSDDKYIASPFNTYQHAGLPPHPIAEPSLDSILAVLQPQKTHCLYYLHDNDHAIHCADSYSGQLHNVNKYLK